MSTFSEYQKKRTLMEFNGPMGQPDPSGVSSPSLKPRLPMPSRPTMGTQPGMSMELPKSDPYQNFIDYLGSISPEQLDQTMQKLEQDLQIILQSK